MSEFDKILLSAFIIGFVAIVINFPPRKQG
jgi:hypothetical protein